MEFALVAPILILLLFGILQYGLYFNDRLSAREGVREAARQGVVSNFGTDGSCGLTWQTTPPSPNLQKLACLTKDRTSALSGRVYIAVIPLGEWKVGDLLAVCEMVQAGTVGGLVPLPNGGIFRTRSVMTIESTQGSGVEFGGREVPPSGQDWNWCTAS